MRRFIAIIVGILVCICSLSAQTTLQLVSPSSYFIEDGKGTSGFDSHDPELAEMALAAWTRESGGKMKFVRAAKEPDATLRIRWISPDDGLYGETQRGTLGGKSVTIVNVSASVAGVGEPLSTMANRDRLLRDSIVYLTCVHEIGHAIGLQHTRNFADIMYFFGYGGDIADYFGRYRSQLRSRDDIPKTSGLSTSDVSRLRAILK